MDYSAEGNSLSAIFFPYGQIPTAFVSRDNFQPYFPSEERSNPPSITASDNGLIWLKQQDSFYSEYFAHTFKNITVTGTDNSAYITAIVANATNSSSGYAYSIMALLGYRTLATSFPLVFVSPSLYAVATDTFIADDEWIDTVT